MNNRLPFFKKVILIFGATAIWGCGDAGRSAKPTIGGFVSGLFEFVLSMVLFVGIPAVIFGIIAGGIQSFRASRPRERERRAHERARDFPRIMTRLRNWIESDCQHILAAEGRKGRPYLPESPMGDAQAKTVHLVEEAFACINPLATLELTFETYVAIEELNRIHDCCTRCGEVNRGSSHPRCLALAESESESEVDIEFSRRGAQREEEGS